MEYIWPLVLVLLNTAWLVLILPGVPGTWLMVLSALLIDWWRPEQLFSPWTIVAAACLAGIGEVLEFLAGLGGARTAGGTWKGMAGAIVGGLIGAVVLTFGIPVIGMLLGACVGAALGTLVMEMAGGMPAQAGIRAGVGAGIGRFVGTLIKLVLGTMIWVILAVAAFWP